MLANLDEHLCLVLVLPAERTIARASIIASWWKWGTVFPSCLLPSPSFLALKKVPHGNKELSQRTCERAGVFSTYVSTCLLYRNPDRQGDRQTHTQTGSIGEGREDATHEHGRREWWCVTIAYHHGSLCYVRWL